MRKIFLSLGIFAMFSVLGPSSFAGSETSSRSETRSAGKVPTFTLDQAILMALQRNPTLLNAEQEIKRTRGVIIQVRAQVLPQVSANANFEWTDPNLQGARILGTTGTSTGGTRTGGPTGGTGAAAASPLVESPRSQIADPSPTPSGTEFSDVSYSISVLGKQLIFNGTSWPEIRGTFFQRDSAYFAFRNVLDQLIATVKTQFYQIVVNRELVKVNEQSVHLLEAQLKDQQNRFEAGTVPRFNVLQAEVALYNQLPLLITAQNNLRISKIVLAKTLGLDFQPRRGENPPLEVVGEMPYIPRTIGLADAIEMGKERRPFLKQARANVLNQKEQLRAAAGQWLPTITTTGGGEWVSSPVNSSWHDISKGWIAQVQGSLPIWDGGAIAGQVLQQRALLFEVKNTYDDDVRQVELEIQQAYSNLQQNSELIQSQEKNVEQAEEALRLAKARLDAGAGTQLDVLNAQVQLLTAQSTRLQALFGYNSSLAEFDRATGAQSTYTEMFADLTPHATKTKTYYTGSGVDAEGKRKKADDSTLRTSAGRSRTSLSK
ncbi:MAG TPA: TolC family protein [Candidatus Udaeobacter sp.]|nr:TolC family protein [Candidatus Udaeobacter sp.]